MNIQLHKPQMQNQKFESMSNPDKKKFFSMDLADRMIKVEQNVSKSFNCPVSTEQTEYFKSMTPSQQSDFKKFMKNKQKKKAFSFFALFAPLLLLALFNINFTGNVIGTSAETPALGPVQILLIVLFALVFIGILIVFLYGLAVERRLYRHIKLIEKVLSRKFNENNKTPKIRKAF